MLSTLAGMLAGLGLFFVGLWTLTENLKLASGRRMRQAFQKYTRRPAQGFAWGILTGAVAQSLTAIVFIQVGMISAGLLTVRAAIPMLAGANVGSSMLVFLSTIDLRIAVLVALGISGIALTQSRHEAIKPFAHGFFGLGLLFLGIQFIQSNAAPLVDQPWIREYLTGSSESFILVFVVAAVCGFLTQSVSAVTILAISLALAGVLSTDLTILTIYGSQLGSGLATLVLSSGLRGSVRQIAWLQIYLTNIFGTTLFVVFWVLESWYGIPLVKALLQSLSDDISRQMAYLYLVLCGPMVVGLFFLPLIERTLNAVAPPSQTEKDAQPNYINKIPLADIEGALNACEREQTRLMNYIARFYNITDGSETGHTLDSMSESYRLLATELDYYLDDLGYQRLSPEQYGRLNRIAFRQRVLRSLAELTEECMPLLNHNVEASPGMTRFANLVGTGLQTTVLTAQSAHVDGQSRDLQRLSHMVGDRSEILDQLRHAYLTRHAVDAGEERMRVVRLTVVAERMFWALDMLRKTLTSQFTAPALKN